MSLPTRTSTTSPSADDGQEAIRGGSSTAGPSCGSRSRQSSGPITAVGRVRRKVSAIAQTKRGAIKTRERMRGGCTTRTRDPRRLARHTLRHCSCWKWRRAPLPGLHRARAPGCESSPPPSFTHLPFGVAQIGVQPRRASRRAGLLEAHLRPGPRQPRQPPGACRPLGLQGSRAPGLQGSGLQGEPCQRGQGSDRFGPSRAPGNPPKTPRIPR